MAATVTNNSNFDTSLHLSPQEQELLYNALNSNPMANSHRSNLASVRPNGSRTSSSPQQLQKLTRTNPSNNDYFQSPIQQTPGSATFGNMGFDDSPFLDYDLDDGNFDWDTNGEQMIGALPGTSLDADDDSELHDKRKNPDDDPDEEDGGGKRREADDKSSKKPGRKPLTSEPTSKRKAQNRAAQRAFRERKERHLKELETKVEDLEKASESANHENGILRAQVDRLQSELKEYRKRLSINSATVNRSPLQSKSNWDINSNFQFEFPKFGDSNSSNAGPLKRSATANTSYNEGTGLNEFASTVGNHRAFSESSKSKSSTDVTKSKNDNHLDDLAGLFSPSILGSVSSGSSSDYLSYNTGNVNSHNTSITSTNNTGGEKLRANTFSCASETTASPSASSISQNGFNSSCGTSPEPSAASPEARKASEGTMDLNGVDGSRRPSEGETAFCHLLSTACGTKDNPIPLAMSSSNAPSSAMMYPSLGDFNGIEWMAQQNGGNFDPVLFGDYRDPQETIMSADFGDFFNDAFPLGDFAPASNAHITPMTNTILESTLPPKKDLMQQIEESSSGKEPEVVPGEPAKQFLTCNMLWDRVTKSERVQSGEADMDDLCTQLKSKAKCSGSGAVIDQKDVDAILGPAPREQHDFLKMFK